MEGMACRVPQIVPDWSGLGEWAKDGAVMVPCDAVIVHTGGLNTVGGIPNKRQFIKELDRMYTDKLHADTMATRAYRLVTQPHFQWSNIARRFDTIFERVLYGNKNNGSGSGTSE